MTNTSAVGPRGAGTGRRLLVGLAAVPLWVLLTAAGLAASLLPRSLELWLGPRLGRLVLASGWFKRATAQDNIGHCFPELGPRGQRALLERNYTHYGILFFEFLHFFSPLPGHFAAYTRRISRLEGYEHWRRAHDKGKGVIVFSCHVGFWEMIAASAGLAGLEPTIVTTVLNPPWLHDKITACRLSTGVHAAHHPGSMPTVLRALKRGGTIAFMNDQYFAPPMGMLIPFFGVKVGTLAAVALLAKRTGAPIVPVSGWREEDGTVRVVMEPEFEPVAASEADMVEKTTEAIAARVEAWVRRHPDQWLWIHRRFKNVRWPAVGRLAAKTA
ncbi:MAG: lysophospholipid acyltransferase family protein [Elusimicrobia bacterium]|nr:lysophospholipid acyltransferase family protein [Elusimicrobiota bacterium]